MSLETDLADMFDAIAEEFAAGALKLRGRAAVIPQDAPGATQAPTFDDLPFSEEWEPTDTAHGPMLQPKPSGSLAVCPAHGIAFLHGKNNTLFCPAKSDDPNWSNTKGYCTVTPKSAAAWLRQHSGAA